MHDRGDTRRTPDGFVAVDEHPAAIVDAHGGELDKDAGVILMHGVGQLTHGWNTALIPDINDMEKRTQRAPGCRHGFGNAQRHATLGALAKIRDLSVGENMVARVAVLRAMGGLQNAIPQGESAELQRLPDA